MYAGVLCHGFPAKILENKNSYRFDYGPTTMIRLEQEKNVFIPCPYSGSSFPTWIINGSYYETLSVPKEYLPSPFGLMIPFITGSLNGITFQCLVPTGHESRFQASTIGKLIVYSADTKLWL